MAVYGSHFTLSKPRTRSMLGKQAARLDPTVPPPPTSGHSLATSVITVLRRSSKNLGIFV